jgi:U3 small nucleolar RNA-associated protein 10
MKQIFAFFLDVFDLRAVGSFLELVTKLNEATFRPLFVRLYDWAVIDLSEGKGKC